MSGSDWKHEQEGVATNEALQRTAGHDSFLGLQAHRYPAAAEIDRSGESCNVTILRLHSRPKGNGIMILAYEEFVEFVAGGTTPQGVIDFHPSDVSKAQVADLIRRQKISSLSPDETAELNQFLQLEHLMRLAKARARQRLAAG